MIQNHHRNKTMTRHTAKSMKRGVYRFSTVFWTTLMVFCAAPILDERMDSKSDKRCSIPTTKDSFADEYIFRFSA